MLEASAVTLPKEPAKRRNEKDEEHRNYRCPCGKSYLSYPALFTHVKYKHEGKAPGKIDRPKSNNKGRPPLKKTEQKEPDTQVTLAGQVMQYIRNVEEKANGKVEQLYQHFLKQDILKSQQTKDIGEHDAITHSNTDKPCTQVFRQLLEEVKTSTFHPSSSPQPNITSSNDEAEAWNISDNTFQRLFIFLSLWAQHTQTTRLKQSRLMQSPYLSECLNQLILSFLPQLVVLHDCKQVQFLQTRHAIEIVYLTHNWVLQKKYTEDEIARKVLPDN